MVGDGVKGLPDGKNGLTDTKGSLHSGYGWETKAGGTVGGGSSWGERSSKAHVDVAWGVLGS